MGTFPNLQVLNALDESVEKGCLAGIAIIGVQHLVETTGSLLESCYKLGVEPQDIFLLGKCYSSNPGVIHQLKSQGVNATDGPLPSKGGAYQAAMQAGIRSLWQRAEQHLLKRRSSIRRIVVLDDGGQCLLSIPKGLRKTYYTVGVEQTTSGVRLYQNQRAHSLDLPVVGVATSAAKRLLEPPLIAKAISSKVGEISTNLGGRAAVVGYGNIGKAVVDLLISEGKEVIVYDENLPRGLKPPKITFADSIESAVIESDVVYGCVGKDVLPLPIRQLSSLKTARVFASCSSGDVEFNKLLRLANDVPSFDSFDKISSIQVSIGSLVHTILRCGFPVNFDRSPESVPSRDIQLTRGLLLSGIVQAAQRPHTVLTSKHREEKLDSALQKIVVQEWRSVLGAEYNAHGSQVGDFENLAWISEQSYGRSGGTP